MKKFIIINAVLRAIFFGQWKERISILIFDSITSINAMKNYPFLFGVYIQPVAKSKSEYPLGFQGMEYYQAPSTISDSIYGSTFFLATGFHGFHVIIGTLFLILHGTGIFFINVNMPGFEVNTLEEVATFLLSGRSLADASIDSRMIQAFSRASSKRMKTMKIWFLTLFVWGPIFQYGYWLRFHFHVIDFSYGNVSFFPWGEQSKNSEHAMIAVPLHIKARAIVYYFRFGD
ncbi:hypothetical protein ACJX0J_004593 (mitochondrion) [Zea mays]